MSHPFFPEARNSFRTPMPIPGKRALRSAPQSAPPAADRNAHPPGLPLSCPFVHFVVKTPPASLNHETHEPHERKHLSRVPPRGAHTSFRTPIRSSRCRQDSPRSPVSLRPFSRSHSRSTFSHSAAVPPASHDPQDPFPTSPGGSCRWPGAQRPTPFQPSTRRSHPLHPSRRT